MKRKMAGVLSVGWGLAPVAYLTVTWLAVGTLPPDSLWAAAMLAMAGVVAVLLARLRVADAVSQAEALAAGREELRRERVVRQAMADLAATLDGGRSRQIVVDAVRAGLEASAAIVERSSFGVMAGDVEGSSILAQLTLEVEGPDRQRPIPRRAADRVGPLIASLDDDSVVLAWRGWKRFSESEAAWLERLAALARVALDRCCDHAKLREQEHLLQLSLGCLPAPVVVRDEVGDPVFANVAYKALGVAPSPRESSPSGPNEEEIVVGNPPRVFMLATVPMEGHQFSVSLYR